ncbi:NUDIX domain-containing protein [Microbacterium sp. YY-01]|uniref:NUDIX domain-containing protein n=1 Tax=Microbacterium sp. YY-01 TaxID=3421634 RepID=UPI003D167223
MSIVPPAPGEPRRPDGPKDPGDAWVIAPDGSKYWGRFGAAGLLAIDPQRGVLLQHRVGWSHYGGTWGLPGGALHEGEAAVAGAIREAQEEAGVPDAAVRPRFTHVLDLGYWQYTTVVADVVAPFEPVMGDAESLALEWVAVPEVDGRDLHPGFAAAWPRLRAVAQVRPVLVVDAANVVGSVPDGWWKDRAGAAQRLRDELVGLRVSDATGEPWALATAWFPHVCLVVEGQARSVIGGADVEVVAANGSGDDEVVEQARRVVAAGSDAVVVTSDRGLAARAAEVGAAVVSAGWLRRQLGDAATT